MVDIKYKNLIIRFDKVSEDPDRVGDINCYVPNHIWEQYENVCKIENLLNCVPYDQFDDYGEGRQSMYVSKGMKYTEITSADVYICFVHWLIYNNIQFKDNYITLQYEDVSWVFHDIYHAENHCDGENIIVSSYEEYDALHFGLDMGLEYTKEYELGMLTHLEQLYRDRFNYRFSKSNKSIVSINLQDKYYYDLLELENEGG